MKEAAPTKVFPSTPVIKPSDSRFSITSNKWLRGLLTGILCLVMVGVSIYVGIKIGRDQSKNLMSQQTFPTPQASITPKPKLPFPRVRNKQRVNYTSWTSYQDKSGYSIHYPRGWYVTEGGHQVESFNPNYLDIYPGAPISGNDAKWDLYFGEETFKSLEEAVLQADQTEKLWDVVEVSSTVDGWPIYFAFKERAEGPFGGPYLIAVIVTPEGKTITWHGYSGDIKSPNIEKLKQIAESMQRE